nr:DNA-directed RNA polymerase subunit alpha C-terminal domain-containing protein [Chromobacterium sp. ASV5]
MTPNNGGPAFPIPNLQHDPDFNGMTLRDYFAAYAAQAIISNASMYDCLTTRERDYRPAIAADAYGMADAMLAARQAPVSKPGIPGELYKLSIEDLELPTRAKNALLAESIYTIGHLLERSEREVLMVPNLSRGSLNTIKDALAARGLCLKG